MRRAAVAATMLAIGLIPAGSATADTSLGSVGTLGGTLDYVKASIEGVVSQDGVPADCDKGDGATGGGGTISGSASNAALNTTAPSGFSGEGWLAEGTTTGTSPRKVTSYAICGETPYGFSTANTPLEPAGQLGDSTDTSQGCGETSEIVLGGVEGSGGNVRIFQAQPVSANTQWMMGVRNYGDTSATAILYYGCATEYDVTRRSDSPTVKPGESGKATVICERQEAVISGGFAVTAGGVPQRDTWAVSTRPWDSSDKNKTPEDGWQVKAYNDRDGKVRLNVYAMCAAK